MENENIKVNVHYVINGDLKSLKDTVWQEFVDHILSVGSTNHVSFAMKTITSQGSETFKVLRDEEIGQHDDADDQTGGRDVFDDDVRAGHA